MFRYPLAFATCTNQFDCFHLLLKKDADPNLQDTNGNTCLHMAVIHENEQMVRLVYENGGAKSLQVWVAVATSLVPNLLLFIIY